MAVGAMRSIIDALTWTARPALGTPDEAVKAAAAGHEGPILDVGCGEGYYAVRVAEYLGAELTGLDISKEAVRCAAAQYKGHRWICGTAAHLPIADDSVGVLMSMFALTMPQEFKRVLKRTVFSSRFWPPRIT
jgi:ubiquinone/menaquinone biosynthesis C-methylase UbiE